MKAENGGLVKWNMGHANVADTHVLNWGPPFDTYPSFFTSVLMGAECLGSLALILGFQSKLASNITIFSMGIVTYIHLFVNNDGILSIFHNRENIFGSFVYMLMASALTWYGPGEYSVDYLMVKFVHEHLD